jgi:hypothetical protein
MFRKYILQCMQTFSVFQNVGLIKFLVGFEVHTAATIKMAVFSVAAPYSLVEFYRRFRGACCLHYQGDESWT